MQFAVYVYVCSSLLCAYIYMDITFYDNSSKVQIRGGLSDILVIASGKNVNYYVRVIVSIRATLKLQSDNI